MTTKKAMVPQESLARNQARSTGACTTGYRAWISTGRQIVTDRTMIQYIGVLSYCNSETLSKKQNIEPMYRQPLYRNKHVGC